MIGRGWVLVAILAAWGCSAKDSTREDTPTGDERDTGGASNAGAGPGGGAPATLETQSNGGVSQAGAGAAGITLHAGAENGGATNQGRDDASAGARSGDSPGGSAGGTIAGGTSAGGASDPGISYTDVGPRLTPATSPARMPPLAGSIELHGEYEVEGTIEPSDPVFVRVLMREGSLDCLRPPDGFEYNVDVYSVTLTKPGPQHLIADTCAQRVDSLIQVYQDATGSASPMDLADACPHLVGLDDDGCGVTFGSARVSLSGLKPGVVLVAVTTFGTRSSAYSVPYTLRLSSDTSVP
ncbi:MAG: hypothetical protein WDO74_36510 [Pseudomonadota bacterium]